jgi:transcriptional regulator with XRE-family HTH domain
VASRKKTRRSSGKQAGQRTHAAAAKKTGAKSKQKSERRPSRPEPSLAERVTQLVEHLTADTLRLLVDRGGRRFGDWLPEAPEMRREAGAYLREVRGVAGVTLDELAEAIDLKDRSLLEAVESGTATLSFDLVLRLAAVLARHDPVPFVSRLVRSQNPVLWQLLEEWGVGRLPLQVEREREFVNILRGHDGARALSDQDFGRVLAFTRSAFETALHFADAPSGDEPPIED